MLLCVWHARVLGVVEVPPPRTWWEVGSRGLDKNRERKEVLAKIAWAWRQKIVKGK